jgi:hypothetical protein
MIEILSRMDACRKRSSILCIRRLNGVTLCMKQYIFHSGLGLFVQRPGILSICLKFPSPTNFHVLKFVKKILSAGIFVTTLYNVKLIWYQFWCTRCAFRLFQCLHWCLGQKQMEIRQHVTNANEPIKTKQSAMNLNQIRRKIELCLREIILRFEMNLQIYYFLDNSFHIRILKQVPKYLATGL